MLLALFISLLAPSAASAIQEDTPKAAYRMGILPYLPALTIDRLYGPLAESFSLELGRLIKLRTKSTFENFASAIEEQSYDILFVHPFFFVDAVDQHGYLPLARMDQPLNAVLVAAKESEIFTPDDLSGRTIGLPPKLAAVSKLIKSALMDQGLRPGLEVGIRHFRNKSSCLHAVGSGAVAACGVPSFVMSEVEALRHIPLRVVFQAPPVSHLAFAIHSRVPENERVRLRDFILTLDEDQDGPLQAFGTDRRFVMIEEHDFAIIRDQRNRLQTLAQR